MLKQLSLIIVLASFFSFANCTENDCSRQTLSKLETLAIVLEDQDASVLDLDQQRAYVDPQKLDVTEDGLIAYTKNTKSILLPELFFASEGYFVKCSEEDLQMLCKNENLRIWWCGTCKAFRSMDKWGRCTRCGRTL